MNFQEKWRWGLALALLVTGLHALPAMSVPADSAAAQVAAGDTLLDGLVGMWEGQYSGSVAFGVDRLIVNWKYDRKILQLQSRTSTGPRKGFEVIAFIKPRGEGRYVMNVLDSSGSLATLEGKAEGRGLMFQSSGNLSPHLDWSLDWSRPRRLVLARHAAGGEGPDEKYEIRYARGNVRKP